MTQASDRAHAHLCSELRAQQHRISLLKLPNALNKRANRQTYSEAALC